MKKTAHQNITQKQSKKPKNEPIVLEIDKVLSALQNLNELQQKSYLTAMYRRHSLVHEKRIFQARKELWEDFSGLKILLKKTTLSEKFSTLGQNLIENCEQLSLDLISLGCLRFRVGDDAEALTLREKILKFSSTISKFLEALPIYLHQSSTRPNLQLLHRQLNVLEDAFQKAYPLDYDDEVSLSLDQDLLGEDSFILEDDHVAFEPDEAYSALQAFLYTARLTCQDIETLTATLAHWRIPS